MSQQQSSEYRFIGSEQCSEEPENEGSDAGFCSEEQSAAGFTLSWFSCANRKYTLIFSAGLVLLGASIALAGVGIFYLVGIERVCLLRHSSNCKSIRPAGIGADDPEYCKCTYQIHQLQYHNILRQNTRTFGLMGLWTGHLRTVGSQVPQSMMPGITWGKVSKQRPHRMTTC